MCCCGCPMHDSTGLPVWATRRQAPCGAAMHNRCHCCHAQAHAPVILFGEGGPGAPCPAASGMEISQGDGARMGLGAQGGFGGRYPRRQHDVSSAVWKRAPLASRAHPHATCRRCIAWAMPGTPRGAPRPSPKCSLVAPGWPEAAACHGLPGRALRLTISLIIIGNRPSPGCRLRTAPTTPAP